MQDLPRARRLRGHDSVSRLFADGTAGAAGVVLVRALPNPEGSTRVAAVAGKKLGNAVCRNRMKRRLRAAFRTERETLPAGWDLALIARRGLLEAEWPDVIRNMHKAVERAIHAPTGPRPFPRRP